MPREEGFIFPAWAYLSSTTLSFNVTVDYLQKLKEKKKSIIKMQTKDATSTAEYKS